MKTRLIWRESWYNNDNDSFWVECTDQEVVDKIMPLKFDSEFLTEIKENAGHSLINQNENENIFRNFFLVSIDLKDIKSFNWVYPYSGMWNAGNPFEKIDVVDFENMGDLKNIFSKLHIKKQY